VLIYFVGDAPRNNVGKWTTKRIVDRKRLSGREFYALKDKAMSDVADYGFVLWDGKSPGSVQNMLWLSKRGKKIVVYKAPDRTFNNLANFEDLVGFLANSDEAVLAEISGKIRLPDQLLHSTRKQTSLNL
jgi:adenine-specific DNA-methyltransferase